MMGSEKKDDFDKFVESLQAEVDAQDRKDFSEYALSLGKKPYKCEEMPEDIRSVEHKYRGPCGDAIKLFLNIEDDKITDINFVADGCTTSIIAASQMVKMVEGKSIEKAKQLSQEDVLEALGKFPKESHHCAKLAVDTLTQTLDKYKNKRNS